MKLSTIIPSLLAGGLLFGSALGNADRGDPPAPPRAAKAPKAPKVSVQVDGLEELVEEHLQTALDAIGGQDQIPPVVRDKLTRRLDKLRKKLKARAAAGKLDAEALGELGEEIGEEMEQFGEEMEEWGEQFGKQMQRKFRDFDVDVHVGDDDDDDDDDHAGLDLDDDDLDDAIRNLKLTPAQRAEIRKLRADSDAKVAAARRELDRASDRLRDQLAKPGTSEAEISRSIDAVTQQEAAIRKARILAWVNARRVLDDTQRTQVQGAVEGRRK